MYGTCVHHGTGKRGEASVRVLWNGDNSSSDAIVCVVKGEPNNQVLVNGAGTDCVRFFV